MQPTYNDFQNNIKNDNSDTFWLIFADYCDENEIAHDIREQINIPCPDLWSGEWASVGGVGCGYCGYGNVGCGYGVGCAGNLGYVGCGNTVGNWVGSMGSI